MRMPRTHTNTSSSKKSADILDGASQLVKNLKVHQDTCREVVDLASQTNFAFSNDRDWNRLVQELSSAIQEWADLTPLESLLKCDIIAGKIASLRNAISGFCGISYTGGGQTSGLLSDASSLIPTILAVFSAPDVLDSFDALPSAHGDTAISLLRRVLASLSPENSPLSELVSGSIKRLESREVELNFNIPDLSADIKLIQSQPISSGHFGDVYLAKHCEAALVAVRVLKSVDLGDARGHKALGRDLQLRMSVQHPNLLPFLGLCSTNLGTCMVSPYMPNGNVNIYLESHPEANAIALLFGAAGGLQYLHGCWPAIAHGDVRGANILVSPTGDALLADHGLSKIIDQKPSTQVPHTILSSLNASINPAGIRWAAPEIVCREEDIRNNASSPPPREHGSWRGKSSVSSVGQDALIEVVTSMSDVWSFGMTIYELLTTRNPYYQHARVETVILAISLGEQPLTPASQDEVRPEWQPELWNLMQECWWMDRRQRAAMNLVTKRLGTILSKSMVTQGSLERARSPSAMSSHISSNGLSRMRSHSILRAMSPSSTTSNASRIARSVSNPSFTSRAMRTTAAKSPSMVGPSRTPPPSSSPVDIPTRTRSPDASHYSHSSRDAKSYKRERKSIHSSLSRNGSGRRSRDEERRSDNLHPVNVTVSGNMVDWNKMSLTQRRTFIHSCATEGSTPPSRAHSPMQSLPSSSPPRSPSPWSSQNGHQGQGSGDSKSVLIPIRASPLTPEAISLPSKLTRIQPSKITIPIPKGFRDQNLSADTARPNAAERPHSSTEHTMEPSRSRASAPTSVDSVASHETHLSDEAGSVYVPREPSFDILTEGDDSTVGPRTIDRRDVMMSPNNEPPDISPSRRRHWRQPSDWMNEAFSGVSFSPTERTPGHIPEDVISESSHSQHSEAIPRFPPGLDVHITEPEPRTLAEELHSCAALVEQLLRDETEFISTSLDHGILQWVGHPEEALVPLMIAQHAEKGIQDAYKNVTAAHHDLQESLVSPLDLCSLDKYSEFFEQHRQGLSDLSLVYGDYVEALSNLNDILTNALDGDFDRLYDSNEAKYLHLSSRLRGPFTHLGAYAACLGKVVDCLSHVTSHETGTSWKQVARDWDNFSYQIRLLSWQASLGRRTLVPFQANDLFPSNETDKAEASRRHSQFQLIDRQSKFVGEAKSAGKKLQEILMQVTPDFEPLEISAKLSDIYGIHLALLEDLYAHQREHHPSLPSVLSILLGAVTQWDGPYTSYSQLLTCVLRDSTMFTGEMDGATIILDLKRFLLSPFGHLRGLLRDVNAILDATIEQHTEAEPLKQLIHLLGDIIKPSFELFDNASGEEDVECLKDLLSWRDIAPLKSVNFDHHSRHVLRKGVLRYPVDPSGARVSIDDRGSSVEVFVVLFDNCLLVTHPQITHGVQRLYVKAILHLDDIFLPDSEATRASQQQIFLLDSEDGKKIAAPVLLRYRDLSTPRNIAPRPRATSTASALGIRAEDGMHLLYPNELLLLADSPTEGVEWRTQLALAKLRLEETDVKPITPRNMFRLVPTATLPFEPTSSAQFFVDGERIDLLCTESGQGGIFVQKGESYELHPCITGIQAKQCCVIDALRLALVLVGKALWALKLDDLLRSDALHPVVIKTGVSLFRVGYQRGQMLLVVACETSKYTLIKWYTSSSRMSRPSLSLSSSIFGRSKKLFRLLGEQETRGAIHGLEILDCGVVTMGVSGFQLLLTDQTQTGKTQELPQIRPGASSEAAQRCRTSKAIGATRFDNEILLCYSDFGVYVSTSGDIVGRPIDWASSRISNVSFAAPYFFLIAENHIEVRLLENGRKLETVEGEFFKLVCGVDAVQMSARSSPGSPGGDSMLEIGADQLDDHPGLLHLAARRKSPESAFDLVELQMEVLDLAP